MIHGRTILGAAVVVLGAILAAVAPNEAHSTTQASCAAGSVKWLERWDRAYAGKVLRPTAVYRQPGRNAFLQLATADAYGFQSVVPIVAQRVDRRCRPTWFRVRLQHYPNGTLGWIRAGTVATSRIRTRIVVDVSQRRLYLYSRGTLALVTPAAVGKPGTPTPFGRFFVTQRFILTDPHGPYGARALGISAFSNVLRSWRDGGPVGIHGTNEPFSIGRPVSHGCVRLPERAMLRVFARVPLATPVVIRP